MWDTPLPTSTFRGLRALPLLLLPRVRLLRVNKCPETESAPTALLRSIGSEGGTAAAFARCGKIDTSPIEEDRGSQFAHLRLRPFAHFPASKCRPLPRHAMRTLSQGNAWKINRGTEIFSDLLTRARVTYRDGGVQGGVA